MSSLKALKDGDTFDTSGVVFLDFWGESCGSCKRIMPLIEMLDDKYEDVSFYGVEDENGSSWFSEYEVQAMPTFLILLEGEIAARLVGTVSKKELMESIDGALG